MKRSILSLVLLGVGIFGGITDAADTPASARPNILFIVSDDQRGDCVGALGHPDLKTPDIDALVARGHVFRNAYCMGSMVGAVCQPSRTMLMTGRSLRRHLADYYAITSHLGYHVGRVLDELKTQGRIENTLIIYTSDHGLAVGGMHGLMGKQNLYEHNKPPLIIAGPAIAPGRSDALVYLYDLFPTLCDYAGLAVPERVDGLSLLPVIRGEKKGVRDRLLGGYRDCQRMIRDARWKLIEYRAANGRHTQLFDLENAPEELRNLAAETAHSVTLAKLRQELAAARASAGDPTDFNAPFTRIGEPKAASAKKKKAKVSP